MINNKDFVTSILYLFFALRDLNLHISFDIVDFFDTINCK